MNTPQRFRIDTSTHCQLKCPSCPNSRLADTDIGKGLLDTEQFKRLLDNDIKRVEFGNWGEPLLHPKFADILAMCEGVEVGVLTNLNTLTDEVADALATYADRVCVSLDGATQETYKKYRVGGNFELVIANVEKINASKRWRGSKKPEVVWQFLVFGHNEHEIALARSRAGALGMSWALALPTTMDWQAQKYDCTFSPPLDHELVRRELGFATLEEQRMKGGTFRDFGVCNNLWDEPAINWDGKVMGCCCSLESFGGNAFDGFAEAMNNEVIQYAREMVIGVARPEPDIPCSKCIMYRMMERHGTWLSR